MSRSIALGLFLCFLSCMASAKSLHLITTFYPLTITIQNLIATIPSIELTSMAPPQTGCLHDYQLTPANMKALERGDILIANGAGLESFLSKVIAHYPRLHLITATKGIDLLTSNGLPNPHVWVSITLNIAEVQTIGQELLPFLSPADQVTLRANTARYLRELTALQAEMHRLLAPFKGAKIVTFHEAFPYFAREFQLDIVDVVEREPGSEPSPRELARLIERIRSLKVKALFAEPQYSSKVASTIARETGHRVYLLDPAVTGSNSPHAYVDIMKKNAEVLMSALR